MKHFIGYLNFHYFLKIMIHQQYLYFEESSVNHIIYYFTIIQLHNNLIC